MAAKKTARRVNANRSQPTSRLLKLGDLVRIQHYGGQKGRIVEFRGELGPAGARIYRVRVRRKPTSTFIELREDQLELVCQ